MKNVFHIFMIANALVLAACGGGGGGGGGGGTKIGDLATANHRAVGQGLTAAQAVPNSGSVTQSSNTTSNTTNDRVTVTEQANGSLTITNGSTWTLNTATHSTEFSTETAPRNAGPYSGYLLEHNVNNGYLVAATLMDDTDYLVGGLWFYVPDDLTTDDVELGVFADGYGTDGEDKTPASYLGGNTSATFNGESAGLFWGLYTDARELQGEAAEFIAEVELTATFGSTPTISGTVSRFRDGNEAAISIGNPLTTDPNDVDENPSLTLGTASIANAAGGFFTGDTSYTSSGNGLTGTGKWGGEFYGTQANSAIGTFGVAVDRSIGDDQYQLNLLGIFNTAKQ